MTNFTDFQKQGLEPVRHFAGVAVEVFEQIARKNYALLGDTLDFAVGQARLPFDVTEPSELLEAQVTATKTFVELLGSRANEYVELGKNFQEKTAELIDTDIVEPLKTAA